MKKTSIFTIGHSNHGLEKFLSLLKDNHIEIVVDIRSRPYSRFASQFNRADIREYLNARGIRYLFLGDKLGCKPDGAGFYDSEGHVVYSRIAETPEFHEGIERIIKGGEEYRIVLMCSEENPINCHRYHLVSKVLENQGVFVVHIRGDGGQQCQKELARALEGNNDKERQLNLFSL